MGRGLGQRWTQQGRTVVSLSLRDLWRSLAKASFIQEIVGHMQCFDLGPTMPAFPSSFSRHYRVKDGRSGTISKSSQRPRSAWPPARGVPTLSSFSSRRRTRCTEFSLGWCLLLQLKPQCDIRSEISAISLQSPCSLDAGLGCQHSRVQTS